MKKIALIYMGGTFGCVGDPLSPMPEHEFIPKLKKILPLNLEVDCFTAPTVKDSSACTASDWLLLVQFIQKLQLEHYLHFVIVHGTDTLSYAAATLAQCLQQSCHVILTGSQYPLLNVTGTEVRGFSDARDNLNTALDHITRVPAGVYVSFYHQVIHACTANKVHTTALDAFRGVKYDQALDHAEQPQWVVQDEHIEKIKSLNILNWSMLPLEKGQLCDNLKNVLNHPPHFLILQGYGTGNLAVDEAILEQIKALQARGCMVILDTQVLFGGLDQRYAISQWVQDAHIVLNDTHSHAELYAKILKIYLQYPTSDQWHDRWYSQ